MLSVELGFLAEIMDAVGHGSSSITLSARTWSNRIKDALWDTTVSFRFRNSCHELICASKIENGIFAYETNGLGSKYLMDDANVPVWVPASEVAS